MHYPSIPNYDLLELIGEGGYGLVYKAQQNNTGQLVAIKVLKTNAEWDSQKHNHQKARFERETQLCARINHPHIVQLLDKGYTNEGNLFAVFEYIAGQTLKERIMQQGGLPTLETSILMGQVLDALVCAHEQGIVHRDLKPQNIMVTHTGATPHIKVLDFGIGAFTYEYRTQDYKSLTLTKEMIGTPSYSAPEQLRGEPPTIKSDIYAWGLTFVECLTGKTVIEGDSIAAIFQQQLHVANVPLPSAVLGHPVADLLRRALDKNPRTRTGSTLKLHEEYSLINFNTLVGKIAQQPANLLPNNASTEENELELVATGSTKRQITILCMRLSLKLPKNCLLDMEVLDSLQKDQLNLCTDIALRYGGYIAGSFANTIGVYFGYPQVSDNDARRAGRTALELVSQTKKRSVLLQAQYGISLDLRVSLHTGSILIRSNQVPEGRNLNVTYHLLNEVREHPILVSSTARQLLDPYLEFGTPTAYHLPNTTQVMEAYALLGERQTEALSFLRPWSANRLMIGRDREKQQVLNTWQQISAGQAASILVSGQAGIGKSKLIYEAKKQLRSEGYLVRECRCLSEHTNNALFPLLDMLRKHWQLEDNEPDSNLARLEKALQVAQLSVKDTLPILCSWLSIPLGETYETSQATPEKQKAILLNALEKLIFSLDPTQKFLLIVEDLHWLDPTSKELLEKLLANISEQNYLLLMTTRPHFQPDWTFPGLTNIALQPLEKAFVRSMVEEVLERKLVTDEVVDYIAKRADGVPLFVEELTRMMQEQGYLGLKEGVYQLGEQLDTDAVPITLKDLLNARLDRLGLAKETAQLAATIGRDFEYDLLIKASLREEALVQADLDQLMNADLVYRQRSVQGEGYIFRHALIRDAAYDGMTNASQKDTHQRIATTLKEQFPQVIEENPFEVARHFSGGEMFVNAAGYGKQALKKLIETSSNQEALLLYNTIGDWIHKIDVANEEEVIKIELNKILLPENQASIPSAKQVELMQQWLELESIITIFPILMTTSGYGSESIKKSYERGLALIESIEENKYEFIAAADEKLKEFSFIIRWYDFLYANNHAPREQCTALALQLLQTAQHNQSTAQETFALSTIAFCHWLEGRYLLAKDHLDQCIALYGQAKEYDYAKTFGLDPCVWAFSMQSLVYSALGNIDKAKKAIGEGIQMAAELKHVGTISYAYVCQGLLGWQLKDKAITKAAVEAQKLVETRHGEQYITGYLSVAGDWVHQELDYSHHFVTTMWDNGVIAWLSNMEAIIAANELALQQPEPATVRLEKTIAWGQKDKEVYYLSTLWRLLALASTQTTLTNHTTKQCFLNAIQVAEKQQVLLFELEATLNYCRYLQEVNSGEGETVQVKLQDLLHKLKQRNNAQDLQSLQVYTDTMHLLSQANCEV